MPHICHTPNLQFPIFPTDTINWQPGGFEHFAARSTGSWYRPLAQPVGTPNGHQIRSIKYFLLPSDEAGSSWLSLIPHVTVLFVSALHAVLERKVLVKLCNWKRQLLLGNFWIEPQVNHR